VSNAGQSFFFWCCILPGAAARAVSFPCRTPCACPYDASFFRLKCVIKHDMNGHSFFLEENIQNN
jgi:hypothetical protein